MNADTRPGGRLITQQLLYSALLTQESRIALTAVEITDLASLIDVYCLFDAAHVLGRSWNVLETEGSGSELGEMLSEYVVVDEVEAATTENLKRVAEAHRLTAVAALHETGRTQSYGQYSDEDDVFDERGFIYLAYSDLRHLPFTPDVRRAEQIRQLARAEDTFAGELLSNLRRAYPQRAGRRSGEITSRVSPLAGVVFDRAVRNRRGVASEIRILRDELAPLRARLSEAEHTILYGSYAEAQKVENNWRKVLKELELAFGDQPNLIEIGSILNYGEVVAELVDDSASARGWLNAILKLPFDVTSRILRRRPMVEIHRLRANIPSGGRLAASVETLFGVRL